MREGITVEMSSADWDRLEAVMDRNSPQKQVWRSSMPTHEGKTRQDPLVTS